MSYSSIDTVFLLYFITHIPITLCVDVMPLLPLEWVPAPLMMLNQILSQQLADPFMVLRSSPSFGNLTWFHSLLVCELAVQLPFFFYATWALWHNSPHRHAPLLVYGVHVATTMAPILGTLAFDNNINRSSAQRLALAGLYLPYLLIPLAMAYVSYTRCTSSNKLKTL